ncbi:MAG TPA: prephenate dehydrogenase/arogenate dehydrogenase family protein [Acidimicrobiales bacterium]
MTTRRANIIGTGLIGGSLGLALRSRGWRVSGTDRDAARVERALELGAIDDAALDPDADITFVAVPVLAVADVVKQALATTRGIVTDVGSVKAPIVRAVGDSRFVGGHPMAGSEQEGIDGADASMFEGAVWVLTPTPETDDDTLARLAAVVGDLGADVVALPPERHDALVAVVSHVPHLTAVTLMRLAAARAEEHAALLRLAAGGFRDMTRVASGHPAIWPDICAQNRDAIVETLDALIDGLQRMRDHVDRNDRAGLLQALAEAREARTNLPMRGLRPAELVEVRVPVVDREGVAAEVFTLAAELGVNVFDFEVAHSPEGTRGVIIAVIDAGKADLFRGGLIARGYHPSIQPLA